METRARLALRSNALRNDGWLWTIAAGGHSARGRHCLLPHPAKYHLSAFARASIDAESRDCSTADALDWLRRATQNRSGVPGVLFSNRGGDNIGTGNRATGFSRTRAIA